MDHPIADPTAGDRSENQPSTDDLFEILADDRRRAVVAALADRPEGLDLDRLAGEVAAATAAPTATVSEATERRVRLSLHHVHLPKMDECGILAYDRDDRTAALEPGANKLAARLM